MNNTYYCILVILLFFWVGDSDQSVQYEIEKLNLLLKLFGCAHFRHQCGSSGGWSDWSQETTVRHLGKHGECSQQDGQHWSTGEDTGTVL